MNYQYYAIKRIKDGKFISGTDWRYEPPHSIFADAFRRPLLLTDLNFELEIRRRRINMKNYKLVRVMVVEK